MNRKLRFIAFALATINLILCMLLAAPLVVEATLQPPDVIAPPLWVFQGQAGESGWLLENSEWSRIQTGSVWWTDEQAVLTDLARRDWDEITVNIVQKEIALDDYEPGLDQFLEMLSIDLASTALEIKARRGPWQVTIHVDKEDEFNDDPFDDIWSYVAILTHMPPLEAELQWPTIPDWRPVPGSRLVKAYVPDIKLLTDAAYSFKVACSPQVIIEHYTRTDEWAFQPWLGLGTMGFNLAGNPLYMYIEPFRWDAEETVYNVLQYGSLMRLEEGMGW